QQDHFPPHSLGTGAPGRPGRFGLYSSRFSDEAATTVPGLTGPTAVVVHPSTRVRPGFAGAPARPSVPRAAGARHPTRTGRASGGVGGERAMLDFFERLFDPSGFTPRARCGDWSGALVALHVASDVLIGLAYLAIPLALLYFVRRRRDIPFRGIFVLF